MSEINTQDAERSEPSAGRARWMRIALALAVVAVLVVAVVMYQTSASTEPCDSVADMPLLDPADLPAGLGRGFPAACLAEGGGAPTVEAGAPAPNFFMMLDKTGPANAGASPGQLSLESLQGRPVFINFWASWCGPCRLEMPDIVEAAGEYEDLVVLAVNVQEEAPAYEAFVNDFSMEMPVVLDQNGELRRLFGVRNMPTSIFIDRDGTVSTVWAGLLTPDKLQELLSQIL